MLTEGGIGEIVTVDENVLLFSDISAAQSLNFHANPVPIKFIVSQLPSNIDFVG